MAGVYLRALTMDDLEWTYKWHSDQELYKTLVGSFRFVSIDAEREWLQGKSAYSNQEVNLMICLKESNQPIGMISVREIDWIARQGHLAGIMIGEFDFLKKGYGTEALSLMNRHCFQDLGLNKIYTTILADNGPSLQVFKKCGYQVEGQLRQHAFKDGQLKDLILVGLCADRYFATKE